MSHDQTLIFLVSLAVLLGVARLAGEALSRIGWPAVVGEILTGIFVGKTVLGRLAPSAYDWLFPTGPGQALLQGYTTVAVVLLLVVAGLEVDLTTVRRSGRALVITSVLSALVPAVLGYATGALLPDHDLADPSRRGLHAAFLAIALAISALPVITRTLLDLGLMKSDLGLLVLSAAVLNDLFGWIGFSVLAREMENKDGGASHSLIWSIGLTLGFLVVTLVVLRPVVDRWLRAMAPSPEESPSTVRVLSMVMVLALLGASATEALGIHAVFGGFVVGLAIGDSPRLREHQRMVLQDFVTSIFTPVFFATMALRQDFAAAFDPWLVGIVTIVACVGKIAGSAIGARLGGIGKREALAIGFGMNSRGAMEILLARLAVEAKIINEKMFVALVIMAVVTSLISGPAMARLLRAAPSPIEKLLRSGAILLDLKAASRRETIFGMAAALAQKLNRPADAAQIGDAVWTREEVAGTGTGEGVAMPHAEIEGLTEPALAFARVPGGVDFDAPDGEKADLVFLLATPPRDYERSLRLLSGMARLLAREEVRARLRSAESAAEIIAALRDPGTPAASVTPIPRTAA